MQALEKLTAVVDGRRVIVPDPPRTVRIDDELAERTLTEISQFFDSYKATLPLERRVLIDRFSLVDVVRKVVGVGSVGTRCFILLLESDDGTPLFLQFKQATQSVLEQYLGRSIFEHSGQRVVEGQRLIQATSDMFLGWARWQDNDGKDIDFYFRQLWDGKGKITVEELRPARLAIFAGLCGKTLAFAHARSGDPMMIRGYIGEDETFDDLLPEPDQDVIVYRSRDEVPRRMQFAGSTLQRMTTEKLLRVGYQRGHLPYTYFNRHDHLVGYDVELVHRPAKRLGVRVEFVPYRFETLLEQFETGEIDVAVGGVMMKPERLARIGFSAPYQSATLSVVIRDYRRKDVQFWNDPRTPADLRLGSIYKDVAIEARRLLPNAEIVDVDSFEEFFAGKYDLDGMLIAAEEGAAWNVLHPEYAVVVPEPVTTRPVAMAARASDPEWLRFLDGWVEFERVDGTLERLRDYWIQGGGTRKRPPRWCVLRDILHWLP